MGVIVACLRQRVARALQVCPIALTLALAACGSETPTGPAPAASGSSGDPGTATSVAVTCTADTSGHQCRATAQLSNGSSQDITSSSTWTSSNTAIATVDGTGRVTHIGSGQTEIRATYQNLFGGAIVLVNVTVTSVTVTCTLESGAHVCTAVARLSSGTTQDVTNSGAVWSSSNTDIATVNSTGRVTHISNGQVEIGARFQSVTGGVVLTLSGVATTVSVAVSCTPQTGAHQCAASASFSDGTSRVVTAEASWTSSNIAVATVDSSGRVTHKSTGQTQIRATFRNVTGAATLDVFVLTLTSISVSCMPQFEAHQCTAIGNFNDGSNQTITSQATWTSSNAAVATVDSTGLVRHRSTGQVEIRATYQGVASSVGLDIAVGAGGSVVINEFALRSNWGSTDDFVELRNDSPAPVDISGWQIREWRANDGSISVRFIVPAGVTMLPGCHYLAAVAAYSSYYGVTGDGRLSELSNDGGIALVRADGTMVDQVGVNPNSPFKEGTTLPPTNSDFSPAYTRSGNDTNDNASDFVTRGVRTMMNSASSCAIR
jgi:uncharacterized protein YjdB